MRPAIFPLCVLAASLSADSAAAAACRLRAAECARALHEVAADAEALAADEEVLGLGLPAPVAAEVVRLQACRALDDAAVSDPLCR